MSTGVYIMDACFHFHSPLYYQPKNSHIFDQYNGGQKLVKKTEKKTENRKKFGIHFQILKLIRLFFFGGGG